MACLAHLDMEELAHLTGNWKNLQVPKMVLMGEGGQGMLRDWKY